MVINVETTNRIYDSSFKVEKSEALSKSQPMKEIEYDPKGMSSYEQTVIRNQVNCGVIDLKTNEFINNVEKNGISKDINWGSLKLDLYNINPGGLEGNNFNKNIEFLSSKYVVLKEQINRDFKGDELMVQMEKLDSLFEGAVERLSNSIADQVGAFFDKNGSSGDRDKVYTSVKAIYSAEVDGFSRYISNNSDYANIQNTKDKWLERDSYYMASKLRESCNQPNVEEVKGSYSKSEVSLMATFVDTLKKGVSNGSGFAPSEESIGLQMGLASIKTSILLESNNLSKDITSKIKLAQSNYFNSVLDEYDKRYEEAKKMPGSLKEYSKVNREAVYNVSKFIIDKYSTNNDVVSVMVQGIDYATQQYNLKRENPLYNHLNKYKYCEEFFRDMNLTGVDRFNRPIGTKDEIINQWNRFISEPNVKNKYIIKENTINQLR
ncbi:MAG: hypothetical protein RSA01_02515 [Clostridium sp.]|uniref:hypothetical protein n=1 Tax=Clostridium sp. TaxID=1506 RepID=UPI002FCA1AEF